MPRKKKTQHHSQSALALLDVDIKPKLPVKKASLVDSGRETSRADRNEDVTAIFEDILEGEVAAPEEEEELETLLPVRESPRRQGRGSRGGRKRNSQVESILPNMPTDEEVDEEEYVEVPVRRTRRKRSTRNADGIELFAPSPTGEEEENSVEAEDDGDVYEMEEEEDVKPKKRRGRKKKEPLYKQAKLDPDTSGLEAEFEGEVYEFEDPEEKEKNRPLQDTMKLNFITKVNQSIIETAEELPEELAALANEPSVGPGKCHCCGEELKDQHRQGSFICTELDCGKRFKMKTSLERHRRVIHADGVAHDCPVCGTRCADKGTLARHMYTHTGLKPYSCKTCNTMFTRKYHLDRHLKQTGCDGKPRPSHPCQVCGKMFTRKDNLREHLRAHAGQSKPKKTYPCDFCDKVIIGSVSMLKIHMRRHTGERPFKCDHCPKDFISLGALTKHVRTHTGEKPYECKECMARFTAKETLNRHLRTHSGVKPHECQYCGKSFIQPAQLKQHIFHHTGEFGFKCDSCDRSFNRKARLEMHVKFVHEGVKPFPCSQCDRKFVRREDLLRHENNHDPDKQEQHQCPICNKIFTIKASLRHHLLTHTREPPRACDECGRAFIRRDCYVRHVRRKHPELLEQVLNEEENEYADGSTGTDEESSPMAGGAAGPSGINFRKLAHSGQRGRPIGGQFHIKRAMDGSLGAEFVVAEKMEESDLVEALRELLALLVDEQTLVGFGWPERPTDELLEAVIRRCGHSPASHQLFSNADRLRYNARMLFTVVIDDAAVRTLLQNQTVDEVILHVLRLAKADEEEGEAEAEGEYEEGVEGEGEEEALPVVEGGIE